MCGISGMIYEKIDISTLHRMTDIIRHRGPDDEGYVLFSNDGHIFAHGVDTVSEIKTATIPIEDANGAYFLGLGHRRLSILDLSSAGHQPMCDEEESVFITYNGELYNYIELRMELMQKGYIFESNCDTEVIINAYKEWKTDCVKKFNGMWAFAIWDDKSKRLFASRDRFGVKPFYYYKDENKFIFGSELKQIIQDRGIVREANDRKVFQFLYSMPDSSEESFVKNIFVLKNSHNLILDLDCNNKIINFKMCRYWDLHQNCDFYSYEECKKEFLSLFESSIALRLRSDVKLGGCLSGGLDSSSIICTLAKRFKTKIDMQGFETFTASYHNKKMDEREYSAEVVKNTNCIENQIFPSCEELKKEIGMLIWHQDEPFGSLSIFAQWCVMKKAKEKNVKVLLDGQGGDEILLGYENYYAFHIKELLKKWKIRKALKETKKGIQNSGMSFAEMIFSFIYFNFPALRGMKLRYKAKKYMNADLLKQFAKKSIVKSIASHSVYSSLFEMQKDEIMAVSLPSLLRFEDRNSMAFSIESRVPFLDYRLVEFAANIEGGYKIKEGWSKAILRDSMTGILPEKIRLRKNKLGFETPQDLWMEKLKPEIKPLFSSEEMRCSKYVNKDKFIRLLNNLQRNHSDIWRVICIELWMRTFDIT